MNLAPLRLVLLTMTLAACSQSEPPVPEFQTVTIDLREPGANVPLPTRKPAYTAAAIESHEETVVAAAPANQDIVSPIPMGPDGRIIASPQTVASSEYGSVTRYFKRWLPDFNKITDCPSGVTCQAAFTN
jgi:hypothetical protein